MRGSIKKPPLPMAGWEGGSRYCFLIADSHPDSELPSRSHQPGNPGIDRADSIAFLIGISFGQESVKNYSGCDPKLPPFGDS